MWLQKCCILLEAVGVTPPFFFLERKVHTSGQIGNRRERSQKVLQRLRWKLRDSHPGKLGKGRLHFNTKWSNCTSFSKHSDLTKRPLKSLVSFNVNIYKKFLPPLWQVHTNRVRTWHDDWNEGRVFTVFFVVGLCGTLWEVIPLVPICSLFLFSESNTLMPGLAFRECVRICPNNLFLGTFVSNLYRMRCHTAHLKA